jgi:hypothetical protein
MKKRINIALGALNFLHRVLSETGVVSKVEARKQHTAFQCMSPHFQSFHERLNVIRKEYRVNRPVKDNNGNETDRWVVPEEKKEEFENKILAVENESAAVEFDVESFSVINRAFDELFEKQAKLKEEGHSNGIANETTMKLINEIARAIDEVQDV